MLQRVFQKPCFKCAHYVVLEEKVGYCKLFGDYKHARENLKLCGPEGKWFSLASIVTTENLFSNYKKLV